MQLGEKERRRKYRRRFKIDLDGLCHEVTSDKRDTLTLTLSNCGRVDFVKNDCVFGNYVPQEIASQVCMHLHAICHHLGMSDCEALSCMVMGMYTHVLSDRESGPVNREDC